MSVPIELPMINESELLRGTCIGDLVIQNPKDGSVLVLIPGGKCLVGSPLFELDLPAFYMGIHRSFP